MRTRTVAQMPVSPETHAEIRRKLEAAGYDHALKDLGLDMDGLALTVEEDPEESTLRLKRLAALMCSMNPSFEESEALEQAGILIRVWDLLRLPKSGTHKVCHVVVGTRCVICGE